MLNVFPEMAAKEDRKEFWKKSRKIFQRIFTRYLKNSGAEKVFMASVIPNSNNFMTR